MVSVTDPYGRILGFLDRTAQINNIKNERWVTSTQVHDTIQNEMHHINRVEMPFKKIGNRKSRSYNEPDLKLFRILPEPRLLHLNTTDSIEPNPQETNCRSASQHFPTL
jgi:hypothetical protein